MLQSGKYGALIGLVTLLGACEVGSGDAANLVGAFDGGAFAGSTVPDGATLRAADGTAKPIELSYGQNARLEVVLEDAGKRPVANAVVRFALDSDAGGSSLQNLEVRTDSDGHATTLLTAGSVDSKFSVRVSATGVEALFLPVEVRMESHADVTVSLSYEGDRGVDSYVLRVFDTLTCDDLAAGLPTTSPKTRGTAAGDDTQTKLRVPAGGSMPLTLQVTALGAANNVVATACASLGSLAGVKAASLRVNLEDTALRLEGNYSLQAELDVSVSADRLAEALNASLATTLSDPTAPNGVRMLNAVQAVLSDAGDADGASWVVGQRATLAPDLEQALSDASVGLTVAMGHLAEQLRSADLLHVGAVLSASGAAPPELAYQPTQLAAVLDGSDTVDLLFGAAHDEPTVPGTISAAFDTTVSALEIDALRLELGLGEYGDALLHALADAPDGLDREALRGDVGCDTFGTWAAGQSELSMRCDDACVDEACTRALDDLLTDTRTQLSALDTDHPALALRGDLPMYDVTGGGVAQQIEKAELTGTWGRANDATDPDVVTGHLGDRLY